MRCQQQGRRVAELTGDSAVFRSGARVDMDSVTIVIHRDNLPVLTLTSQIASADITSPDSETVSLSDVDGTLYYGGALSAGRMRLSFGDAEWRGDGKVRFARPPLEVRAEEVAGPLSMDTLYLRDVDIRAEQSRATAAIGVYTVRDNLFHIAGDAVLVADSRVVRSNTMLLRLDPTFTKLELIR